MWRSSPSRARIAPGAAKEPHGSALLVLVKKCADYLMHLHKRCQIALLLVAGSSLAARLRESHRLLKRAQYFTLRFRADTPRWQYVQHGESLLRRWQPTCNTSNR